MKNFIAKHLGSIVKITQFIALTTLIAIFTFASGTVVSWMLVLFFFSIIVYGLTCYFRGYDSGLKTNSDYNMSHLTDELQREMNKRMQIEQLLQSDNHQKILDMLLDKISKSGKDSLDDFEKALLKKISV